MDMMDMFRFKLDLYAQRNFMKMMFGPAVSACENSNSLTYAGAGISAPYFNDYLKHPFGISSLKLDDGTMVGINEEIVGDEEILALPFCKVLHFVRESKRQNLPRVLIIAPLSGHYATLLRDMIRNMLHDHDVYITDWANARDVPLTQGPFSLDTYAGYLRKYFRFLGKETPLHVIAVCQPCIPALVATALEAQSGSDGVQPSSLTLMGGPIDARINATDVGKYALHHSLREIEYSSIHPVPLMYPGYRRFVYPGFLQHASFVGMNLQDHFAAHVSQHMRLMRADLFRLTEEDQEASDRHERLYDEFKIMMDLPGEFYVDTIKKVFQDFDLAERRYKTESGILVDLSAITETSIFTVEGEADDITGSGQTKEVHELCSSVPDSRKSHLQTRTGHYGLFTGKSAREEVVPATTAVISQAERLARR